MAATARVASARISRNRDASLRRERRSSHRSERTVHWLPGLISCMVPTIKAFGNVVCRVSRRRSESQQWGVIKPDGVEHSDACPGPIRTMEGCGRD